MSRALEREGIPYHIAPWIADVPIRAGANAGPLTLESELLRILEAGTALFDTRSIASCSYALELFARYGIAESQAAIIATCSPAVLLDIAIAWRAGRAWAPGYRTRYTSRIPDALFHTIVRFAEVFARSPLDQAVMRRVQPLESVTRWDMPEHDASIALLKDRHREIMGAAWGGRSSSEVKTMNAFEHITRSLEVIEAPAAVVGLSKRAIDDERRHIEIGRRVASAYERANLPSPPPRKVRPQVYRQTSRRLQALLRVISHCCLNETTACAYAQYSLSIARAPLVHAALREILADEIDHGRVGWAALAAAPPELRAAAAKWLPRLIRTHLAGWRTSLVEWPSTLHAHGMPSKRAALRLVDRTMRHVILPGFAAYGMRTRR